MTAISFSVLKMKEMVTNGIAEAKGFIPFGMAPAKTKRQTIRKINVNYNVENQSQAKTIRLIFENQRLPYNSIKKTKTLQLYWKQRTPECEKLGTVTLQDIFPIQFKPGKSVIRFDYDFSYSYFLDPSERFDLAYKDGFPNYNWLLDWFIKTHGLDVYGYFFAVIRW